MADVTVKIIEPAESFAFLTLEELKIALGISSSDVSGDAQLQWLIDTNSSVISTLCNRVFAKEKLTETWRDLMPSRMFLTHWPIKTEDIETVTCNGVELGQGEWELEEESGKVLLFASTAEPIKVTYTGGYELPDEAPMALKQCCALLVGVSRSDQARAETTGIRMIAHKESRIMFHAPESGSAGAGGGSTSGARTAVNNILTHFMRHWI